MIYQHLFRQAHKEKGVVHTAVIGTGHFGKAIVTQAKYNQFVNVNVVMDKNLESARNAFIDANIEDKEIYYCDNLSDAKKHFDEGGYIYTDKFEVILGLDDIDVICEGTGVPEVGAQHAKLAIENGKHVAMVNKETDSAIGPVLKYLANEKGVIYTPVDGDQHGLLMSLYEWAREIGLTVVSGGKARDGEFIYDEKNQSVYIEADGITVHETTSVSISDDDAKYLKKIPKGHVTEYIKKREEILKSLPGAGAFDLCELTIIVNSTGLKPDVSELNKAALKISELPIAYASHTDGGIFSEEGIIDLFTCFRREDEAGMGGGVFIVVKCDNAYSNYILTTKGQIPNYDRSTAVIYRPYHLCGIETSISIASAGLLNISTGSLDYQPKYDLIKRATRDIKAGETFGNDHDLSLEGLIAPAKTMESNHPVPGHLITYQQAKVDIQKGEIITYDKVRTPHNSTLWELRESQDEIFLSSEES
ncbi:NAD(P)H-dependent oxidoreductase [Thalassobacillus sp. CUG 92003]|uniref:NAD(P)H-dependent oxidoreductase n=1 Tax=Thalassobacillus sp. CUG 92003 TaxID=2736641 RepID=UPI0015E7D567|nr:flagellar biosynthesis protein FlgA [Thalassobacillus sp. CUG 92003]